MIHQPFPLPCLNALQKEGKHGTHRIMSLQGNMPMVPLHSRKTIKAFMASWARYTYLPTLPLINAKMRYPVRCIIVLGQRASKLVLERGQRHR